MGIQGHHEGLPPERLPGPDQGDLALRRLVQADRHETHRRPRPAIGPEDGDRLTDLVGA
jgi:hypothetical protein